MREVLPDLMAWWREGRPVGMATVVATWSGPHAGPLPGHVSGTSQTSVAGRHTWLEGA